MAEKPDFPFFVFPYLRVLPQCAGGSRCRWIRTSKTEQNSIESGEFQIKLAGLALRRKHFELNVPLDLSWNYSAGPICRCDGLKSLKTEFASPPPRFLCDDLKSTEPRPEQPRYLLPNSKK